MRRRLICGSGSIRWRRPGGLWRGCGSARCAGVASGSSSGGGSCAERPGGWWYGVGGPGGTSRRRGPWKRGRRGGEVHRDAVLEGRIRVIVEVDRDVDAVVDLAQPRPVHAVDQVHDVVLVLDADQEALSVLRRIAREQDARRACRRADRREERVI